MICSENSQTLEWDVVEYSILVTSECYIIWYEVFCFQVIEQQEHFNTATTVLTQVPTPLSPNPEVNNPLKVKPHLTDIK